MVSRSNDLFEWVQQGVLKIAITKTFPLKDAVEAHKYLECKLI